MPEEKISVLIHGYKLTDENKTKIRLLVFNAMERAYDLGRRNKLLPINEKREYKPFGSENFIYPEDKLGKVTQVNLG